MSLPKEPRQKMINIMYLVLTALLALNVSSEILNAFKTVRRSLEITNGTVNQSTGRIMTSLEEKMSSLNKQFFLALRPFGNLMRQTAASSKSESFGASATPLRSTCRLRSFAV